MERLIERHWGKARKMLSVVFDACSCPILLVAETSGVVYYLNVFLFPPSHMILKTTCGLLPAPLVSQIRKLSVRKVRWLAWACTAGRLPKLNPTPFNKPFVTLIPMLVVWSFENILRLLKGGDAGAVGCYGNPSLFPFSQSLLPPGSPPGMKLSAHSWESFFSGPPIPVRRVLGTLRKHTETVRLTLRWNSLRKN